MVRVGWGGGGAWSSYFGGLERGGGRGRGVGTRGMKICKWAAAMDVLQIAAKPRCRCQRRSQPRGHRRSAPCERKSWEMGERGSLGSLT
jgi:hypothetical protein